MNSDALLVLPLLLPEIIVAVVCTELLLLHLPVAIQSAIDENVLRRDGTRSRRRKKVEQRQVAKIRPTMWVAFAVVFVPTNLAACWAVPHVIWIAEGISASPTLAAQTTAFRLEGREKDSEREVDEFLRWTRLNSLVTAQRLKRLAAPVLGCAALFWVAICICVLRHAYIVALKRLMAGIESRSEQYYWLDLSRYEDEHPDARS